MGLALLGCCSSSWNSASVHKPLMSCDSSQDIRLGLILFKCPHPFGKGAGSDPYFRMMHVLIAELAPKANLCSNDILLIFVIFNDFSNVLHIKVHPCLIVTIRNSQIVAHTHIQIERAVLGNDDLMVGWRKSRAPPMHDISMFYLNIVAIHPIHHFLVRTQFFKDLVLLSTIMSFHLELLDIFLFQEFSLVFRTCQNNLISSQMHNRIREDVKDFSKDLLDQSISLIKSNIQRTHEAIFTESTSHPLVLGSQPPTGSMPRGIQFRNHPNSSLKTILDHFSGLFGSIGLLRGMSSILGDFRMRIEDEREGIFIHYVPVENTEFVVHHGINSLQDQVEWQEMPRSVDHQAPIRKGRLVFNSDWQIRYLTTFYFVAWALNRLKEGLQCSNKPNICFSFNLGVILIYIQLICLLFHCKYTSKLGVQDTSFNFETEPDQTCLQGRCDDIIRDIAFK